MAPQIDSIFGTFSASIRSVGTAVTLAAVGVYLHRQKYVVGEGKRTLALISQQVTFPLFLFTKIIYCNQDWSDDPCPDVTKSLGDVWILLFWPIYVVGTGIAVGALVAWIANTPKSQVRTVLAACGFGNSTGLPITLLMVVHTNFPTTSDLGRIDPTLFLSVYLLLYPVLQWGIGGWLLAPDEDMSIGDGDGMLIDDDNSDDGDIHMGHSINNIQLPGAETEEKIEETTPLNPFTPSPARPRLQRAGSITLSESFRHNVLNNKAAEKYYHTHRRGLSSSDEGMYISEIDLAGLAEAERAMQEDLIFQAAMQDSEDNGQGQMQGYVPSIPEHGHYVTPGTTPTRPRSNLNTSSQPLVDVTPNQYQQPPHSFDRPGLLKRRMSEVTDTSNNSVYRGESVWETIKNILNRSLQPPVVGAIAGIFCAMTPLRGIFVDLVDRSAHAPLQWLFDALYSVGATAVPINMMILGCNLSASLMNHQEQKKMDALTGVAGTNNKNNDNNNNDMLSNKTMIWIVIGKMIIMPMIGITSALILRTYFWHIPDEIDGAFYLVLMIVFITPTANNVMVMVELSGSNTKEGIARVIALQYAVAPLILSLTMTIVIGLASNWS